MLVTRCGTGSQVPWRSTLNHLGLSGVVEKIQQLPENIPQSSSQLAGPQRIFWEVFHNQAVVATQGCLEGAFRDGEGQTSRFSQKSAGAASRYCGSGTYYSRYVSRGMGDQGGEVLDPEVVRICVDSIVKSVGCLLICQVALLLTGFLKHHMAAMEAQSSLLAVVRSMLAWKHSSSKRLLQGCGNRVQTQHISGLRHGQT